MKRQIVFVWLISGIALTAVPSLMYFKAGASASVVKPNSPARGLARLGELATVHAAGRGAPQLNLADGREVLTAYTGEPEARRLLQQDLVQPQSMASSDFDEDGMPDLVCGYAAPNGGVLTIHRGNVDSIYPNSPEAKQRRVDGSYTDAPFLSPGGAFATGRPAEFIGCGDFNADGHQDVVTAARGGEALYLFPGDGHGNLGAPEQIDLSARVTAMVTGEINRAGGLAAIVVGVTGEDGPKALLFESQEGAVRAAPEIFSLPAEASAIALGQFDDDFTMDVAIASGRVLTILRARDRKLALGRTQPTKTPETDFDRRSFSFAIRSVAIGDFTGHQRDDLALLSDSGAVHLLSRPEAGSVRKARKSARVQNWRDAALPGSWPQARLLARARISTLPTDSLVLIDSANRRLQILGDGGPAQQASRASALSESLAVEGEPIAVLPMRLNGDALSDLVILTSRRNAPSMVLTAPTAIFTVSNTGDTGAGSLRDAINQANSIPGSLINFNLGAGTPTIAVGTVTGLPLPSLTAANTTIDGNTGGATRVELNGSAAGAAADGLAILNAAITVRGMVVNRFSGVGIAIRQGDANIVEGNFVGTNSAGNAGLANLGGGVLVARSGNRIGGTTVAASNVISGNSGNGVALNGALPNGNLVQGNFIGAGVGVTPLANTGSGVQIAGSASNNTIGGTTAGAGNTIAFNVTGVEMSGSGTSISNAVLGNSIFNNEALGIDIGVFGVAPNDNCDGDGGPNGLQNFPVLTSASSGGGNTSIIGTLDSTVGTTFRIEFFSSPNCDGSGNGEGQTFIGATTVSTPPAGCVTPINVNLPVTVPVGNVVTATATNSSNNTSEFSACVTVTAAAGCSGISCPPDLLRFTSPTATVCGASVTFAPTTFGACTTPDCVPPSGSFFAVGTTVVTCTTSDSGAIAPLANVHASSAPVTAALVSVSCSFSITVIDNAPPSVSCPASISTSPLPGQTTAVVNYPPPTVTDNCPQPTVQCTPPSGSSFPIGSTNVTCTATDLASNTSRCIFNIIVIDAEAPSIRCPANVNVVPPAGQTSAVVNYPPPTVSDNLPGATVICVPASGSSFPAGITTVTCTATDAQGNKASCSFAVAVGGPQLKVTIPANRPTVEFATVSPARKPPKPKNNPCSFFTVENIGFGPLTVTLDSIVRTGSDVDSGRITDPNDTRYFSLNRVGSDQSLTPLDIGGTITLQPGQAQNICARFAALIPATAGKTSGLAAANVLPDTVTSRIVFRQTAGANVFVPITARVATGLVLINPINPRTPAVVGFARNGNEITVNYSVFDSNLDVTRAKYEFLNSSGQATGESFEIDLAAPIRGLNLVKGQSFSVEQKFTGANSNADIAGVRLTVFDGETNVSSISSASATPISAVSVQLIKRARAVTLYLPAVSLDRGFRN